MDREVPGFIANRLQEALWREALHMVDAGEATVEQIDLSITDGPGLRWPIHGPMLTFHLAGGQGGMAHMLDHFGPSLQSPWTRLVAAELTPELRDAVVDGCDREADGRTIDDLVAERDRGRDRDPARPGPRMTPVVWREPVQDAWIDYNGHLSEPYYVLVFGHATDAVMDEVGLGPAYREANDASLYTRRGARALPRRGAGRQRPRGALLGHRRHRQAAVDLARAVRRRPAARHRGGPRRARGRAARSAPFPDDVAARARAACVDPPEAASGRIRALPRRIAPAPSGSTQPGEIASEVAQVRPLLLQDHAKAVADAGRPVRAPRVRAFLREQPAVAVGQEVGHQLLSLGAHREDLVVPRRVGAEDRHVEAQFAGTGEDLADLVEGLRHPQDPAAEPRVGRQDEVPQGLGQGPLVLDVGIHSSGGVSATVSCHADRTATQPSRRPSGVCAFCRSRPGNCRLSSASTSGTTSTPLTKRVPKDRSWLSMSSPPTSTLRIVTPLTSENRTVAPLKSFALTKVAPSNSVVPE